MNDIVAVLSKAQFRYKLVFWIFALVALSIWANGDLRIYTWKNQGGNMTYVITDNRLAAQWGTMYNGYPERGEFYDLTAIITCADFIILLVFIIVYLVDETEETFEKWFMGVGCLLNLGTAIALIVCAVTKEGNWAVFTVAAFLLVVAILMAVDFVKTLKNK